MTVLKMKMKKMKMNPSEKDISYGFVLYVPAKKIVIITINRPLR